MGRVTERYRRGLLASCILLAGAGSTPAQRPAQAIPALEHLTVLADGHPLAVWARRPPHQTGAILLVHGATWSARPDFDLQVPGEQRSVLAGFAQRGVAAYAVDLRGYGATPRDATGWLTPRRAANDVAAVLEWIARQDSSGARPALLGWSNGALVVQLVAQQRPSLLSALILYGDYWSPGTRAADDPISVGPAPRVPNSREAAASDFITPGSISGAAIDAYVRAAMLSDPIRAEWRRISEWNTLAAARVRVPTLVMYGERDPAAEGGSQQALYRALRGSPKAIVTLEGGDHAALLENTRPEFVPTILDFLAKVRGSRSVEQPRSGRGRS